MDIRFMERAIYLATLGKYKARPNPLVGAVIVKNGKIVGEGYHMEYGGPHAEINAINSAYENLEGADIYVTLEPCCHYGKTPPCVEKIIERKFKRVYIGSLDPNPLVSGRSLEIFKSNDIEVYYGILKAKCDNLNKIFNKYIVNKEPFVSLKWAMTLDGKIATKDGKSKWISTEKSRKLVQDIRNEHMGILVGINTIIKDNPDLTRRNTDIKTKEHFRIVLDSTLKISIDCKVLQNQNSSKTIIITSKNYNREKFNLLKEKGIEIIVLDEKITLKESIKVLGEKGIDSILIEGGGKVNFEALKEEVVDRIYAFIASKIFGGKDAITPVEGEGVSEVLEGFNFEIDNFEKIDKDILITLNKEG